MHVKNMRELDFLGGLIDFIEDAVWKSMQLTPSRIRIDPAPRLRILDDSIHRATKLI